MNIIIEENFYEFLSNPTTKLYLINSHRKYINYRILAFQSKRACVITQYTNSLIFGNSLWISALKISLSNESYFYYHDDNYTKLIKVLLEDKLNINL